MTPVRVLQVLGKSAGGIARHVGQLAAALDERDGLVIDVAGPPDLPIAMPKDVHPLAIPDGPLGHRGAVGKLRSLLASGDYDVVHAHGLRAGIDAGRAARFLGVPVVLTVHNLVRREVVGAARSALYRWAEPLAVRSADRTFAVSRGIADALRSRVPRYADRIEVLYLGVGNPPRVERSRADVRAELGLAKRDRLVVTASRLSPQKALEVMLQALGMLTSNVVLAVLGRGELERELKRTAVALGVERHVRWLGFRTDAADLIAAADVFCLSSNWEGVPLSAQEAILLGTPVVATDVGGMGELIVDRVSGRLVPRGDAAALAAALRDVLASDEDATAYVRAAREHLTETFSTERMLGRLTDAYHEAAP